MSCKEKNPAVTLTLQDPGVELPGTEAGVEAEAATGAGVEIVAHGGTAGKELRKEIVAVTEISTEGMNREGRIQEGMTREEAIPDEKTPGEKITGGMTPGEGIPGRTTLIVMTPEGMIPGGTTPIGMTQERMISEGMTPRGVIPEGMTPEGMTLEGMIPEGMIPEGMTLRRMTTRGMFPGIETHIKVNRGGMNQVEMMHREMKKKRATLKGGRAEIGKGVNRQDLVQQRRGSKERRAVGLVQWTSRDRQRSKSPRSGTAEEGLKREESSGAGSVDGIEDGYETIDKAEHSRESGEAESD